MEVVGIGKSGVFAELYVAVFGVGVGGAYANGDDVVVLSGKGEGLVNVVVEFFLVENGVVGRSDDDVGLRIELADNGSSIGYAGCCVAAVGLAEHLVGQQVGDLLSHTIDIKTIGDNDNVLSGADALEAVKGALEH